MPLFVLGFLAAIGVTSTNLLPPEVLTMAQHVQEVLLVAALAGLGAGIQVGTLRRTGARALILGFASWVLVGGISYLGVRLLRP